MHTPKYHNLLFKDKTNNDMAKRVLGYMSALNEEIEETRLI